MKRVFLIIVLLITLVPVYGQDFLSKYDNMSPKEVKAFVKDWYLWSSEQASREPSSAVDTLLCKVFDKFYKKWKPKHKYFVLPDKIVVWYHKEEFRTIPLDSLMELPPPPLPPGVLSHDVYNTLDYRQVITPPYRIRKKVLYLTSDIAHVINVFRNNYDVLADWQATKSLSRYLKIGAYSRIRSAPIIIQVYVYPNGYVVPYDIGGWGGSDYYSLELEKKYTVDSWIE